MEGFCFGVPETFHSASITDSMEGTFQLSRRDKDERNKEICRVVVFLSCLPVLSFHFCPVTGTSLKPVTIDFMTLFFFLNSRYVLVPPTSPSENIKNGKPVVTHFAQAQSLLLKENHVFLLFKEGRQRIV